MLGSATQSRWIKCISTQGSIRGVAIQGTELVQSAVHLHQLNDLGAKGLGEALIGALLVASYCKPGQRINLNIQGSGFYQQALVDAYPNGSVRGYVVARDPIKQVKEELQTGPWGTGLLSVLRTKDEESGTPYIGTVPLLTGHLAKDLSFYWVQSEQIPSAVGLSVTVEGKKIVAAGGFLVQALPGATPAEVKTIEQHIHEMHSLSNSILLETSPIQLLSQIFQSTPFIAVEERPLEFRCTCSWERVERSLILVGVAELESMLAEDEKTVVRCDFCSKEYSLDKAKMTELVQSIKK